MPLPTYKNRWMPQVALDLLSAEAGPILDVGGGMAPYARASHVVDVLPYEPERLHRNAWGGTTPNIARIGYTQADICASKPWPFPDKSFALGLCSHTLEDVRDPVPALAELGRVCERLLIVTPSRMLEQTKGIDHPRYCGFAHHPWIVFRDGDTLVLRRKTSFLMFPGCHFTCPFGQTLSIDDGCLVYHGPPVSARELWFRSGEEEVEDYRAFVREHQSRALFIRDDRPRSLRRRVYRLRQWLGTP
jgi:SAM-dependent methyltransferase